MPQSHKPEGEHGSTGSSAIRVVNVSLIAVDLFLPVYWNPDYYAMAVTGIKGDEPKSKKLTLQQLKTYEAKTDLL